MKHKTAELEGALLDAAVALAEGHAELHFDARFGEWRSRDPETLELSPFASWSTSWAHGGPLIEREKITVAVVGRQSDWWFAELEGGGLDSGVEVGYGEFQQEGPTPLIAAMRSYVASKFGEEVELP